MLSLSAHQQQQNQFCSCTTLLSSPHYPYFLLAALLEFYVAGCSPLKQMEGDLALLSADHQHQSNVLDHYHHHQKKNNGGNEQNQKKENNGGIEGKRKVEELPTVTVVMKVDFHCHGCKTRIFQAARNFRGAETVKVEEDKNKLTVVGKVDPQKLHQKLEKSTKKKIELLSPQPKKIKDANQEHKNDNNNNNNIKSKEPPVTTVVFKLSLHCDGCCKRIRHIILKTKGVHTVEIDREKELVTVRGAVDPKTVQLRLKKKMKRTAEIVPGKKADKAYEKSEQYSNGGGGNQKQQQMQKKCTNNGQANTETMDLLMEYYGPIYGHIPCPGYVVERLHAPQIFSDDNPNACSVM
ncbi:hypothetical protein QQ045_017919 [Rhodiola kirilowii]